MENINQIDNLGRCQGLHIDYWSNGYIWYKCYCLNGELINLYLSFHNDGLLLREEFNHPIF
jgi:antitoxin component YwqK of YwqJK toxin-antitoxin module